MTAYAPFTPSNSGQRSLPTYYRGCWHVVSRGFLDRYRLVSSLSTKVYNPKTFFPHAASLGQACAHCPIFPTAASRRSLDRVSVPMWPYDLSVRLPVFGLVGFYPANCLIGHKSLLRRIAAFTSRLTGYQLRFPAVVPLRRTSPCALLTRPLLVHCCTRTTCMC